MGKITGISWTHSTFNPWVGCTRVSPGCIHCYAETMNKSWGKNLWGPLAGRQVTSSHYWQQPYAWNREAATQGERRRVFCGSMCDVFEEEYRRVGQQEVLAPTRKRLWSLIEETPQLDWLLLTKRPENILAMVPDPWCIRFPPNVWVGTSCETQEYVNERVKQVILVPARVLFLSCEPLLESLDLSYALKGPYGVQWVITGGESGPGHRPFQQEWAASIRDQCREHGVAFFHKQNGGLRHDSGGHLLFGEEYHEFPAPKEQ